MTLKFLGETMVFKDHYLLISKICLPHKWHAFIKRSPRQEEIFRVHLLEDPSTVIPRLTSDPANEFFG